MSEARGKEQRQELNIKIGKRCKEARLAAKLTQEKLGELLDVNSQFISDVERGCVGVSLLTLKNLSEILNVTTDYLLKGEEIANKTNNLIVGNRFIQLSPAEYQLMEQNINTLLQAFRVNEYATKLQQ